jgi:hypothetical protein
MEKIVATILLFLFSVDLHASEEFCALDNQDVKSSAREGHDRSSWINLTFPAAKLGNIHRIQLRYDHIDKFGSHEVFTKLAFHESDEGYEMSIKIAEDHKPLMLMATYHLNSGTCYSNLYIVIENGQIQSTSNGT